MKRFGLSIFKAFLEFSGSRGSKSVSNSERDTVHVKRLSLQPVSGFTYRMGQGVRHVLGAFRPTAKRDMPGGGWHNSVHPQEKLNYDGDYFIPFWVFVWKNILKSLLGPPVEFQFRPPPIHSLGRAS